MATSRVARESQLVHPTTPHRMPIQCPTPQPERVEQVAEQVHTRHQTHQVRASAGVSRQERDAGAECGNGGGGEARGHAVLDREDGVACAAAVWHAAPMLEVRGGLLRCVLGTVARASTQAPHAHEHTW